MFTTDCVLYAFLSHSSDCDNNWNGHILDLGKGDILHLVAEKSI